MLLSILAVLQLATLATCVYCARKSMWASRLAASANERASNISVATTRQTEFLDGLYLRLGWQRGTLPPTRSYAGSPDFLSILYDHVRERKPTRILDCGSGLTTIVMARCLQQLGEGHILSLDHDPLYAERTRRLLGDLGLSNFAEVVDAPLKLQTSGSWTGRWYDLAAIDLPEKLDLIVVDGPPIPLAGDEGRYLVAPIAFPKLSDNGSVILDDADRPGERGIVEQWLRQFPHLSSKTLWAEKGCVLLSSREEG